MKSQAVRDDVKVIISATSEALRRAEVVLTSGGAWKSEKDVFVNMLDELVGG